MKQSILVAAILAFVLPLSLYAKQPCAELLREHGYLKGVDNSGRSLANAEPSSDEIKAAEDYVTAYISAKGTPKRDEQALANYLLNATREVETVKKVSFGQIVTFLKASIAFVNSENSPYKKAGLKGFFEGCYIFGPKDPLESDSTKLIEKDKQ